MVKTQLQTAILKVIGVAGVIGFALIAPGIFIGAGIVGGTVQGALKKHSGLTPSKKQYVERVIIRFEQQGLVAIQKTSTGKKVRLTNKGKCTLAAFEQQTRQKSVWDGKWRILTFDVYEHNRSKRDMLRRQIQKYGFMQLQRSVWIYPYECSDFVNLLKIELSFGRNLRYIVAEKIEADLSLRDHFDI